MDEYWKNWKTVDNYYEYPTESDNPVLKKDSHHAEIIDITDGLVVDEAIFIMPDYKLDNNEIMKHDSIWEAFSKSKRYSDDNLNSFFI